MGKFVAVASVLSSVVSSLVLVTSPGLFWGVFLGMSTAPEVVVATESLWPLFDHQQGSTHPSH